jgi:hypothetical protein
MSDYFFYDLNKKMADLADKQQLTEDAKAAPAKSVRSQLNERDLGKHNNATTGFAALAKKTGGGEKGAKIAGAQLAKMRAKGQVEEEVDESALSTPISKAMKSGGTRSLPGLPMQPKSTDEGNPFGNAVRKAKANGIQPGEKINVGGKEYPVKEAAKWRDPEHKGKLYTQKKGDSDDYDDMDYGYNDYGIKKRPANDPGQKRRMGGVGNEFSRTDPLEKGFGRSGTGSPVEKGPRKGLPKRDQITSLKQSIKDVHGTHARPNLPEAAASPDYDKLLEAIAALYGDDMWDNDAMGDLANDLEQAGPTDRELNFIIAKGKLPKRLKHIRFTNTDDVQFGHLDEKGGIPMTPKQKSFAKLAPPVDKITFADKIVGAKKEVDEVLGDVAANAMKKAIQRRSRDMEEGFMDDEPYSRKSSTGGRIDTTQAGVTRHHAGKSYSGAGHDAGADDTPSGAVGRRRVGAGMGTKIGAKINTGKSKLMTREDDMDPADQGEYDQEGSMAKDDIKTVVRHAQALEKILGDNDNLPEWVQAKLAKIEGMMTAVDDYMQNQQGDDEGSDDMEVDEESTNKRDNRGEKAGKRVAKDIEYDEKKKDGIHGQRRDSEDSKAERAGKKVAKDIEYDEKKDKKKKEVDETTSSGSVATSSAAPKSGGGTSYGKGIYDSMNREVEKMISESMSINMSMNNDSHGGPSNTLTVTATDEDALQLAMLLRSAGLGSQEHNDMSAIHNMDNDMSAIHDMDHDHGDEPCPACGSSDCECDEVSEAYGDTDATDNEPDWPTDEEGTDDAMMYSGGLNGPKSTGQTTTPVIAGQDDRMGYEGDHALRRMMEMAGLSEAAATPQDVPEDPPTKPAAKASAPKPTTTKPPVKLATPQAVDDPSTKIKESLLTQLRNFKY